MIASLRLCAVVGLREEKRVASRRVWQGEAGDLQDVASIWSSRSSQVDGIKLPHWQDTADSMTLPRWQDTTADESGDTS